MKEFWRQEIGRLLAMCAVAALLVGWQSLPVFAQAGETDDAMRAQQNAAEKELESIAIIDRKVMVPMRDGKRMQTDIYRPKDQSKKYPLIFVRMPYNSYYRIPIALMPLWDPMIPAVTCGTKQSEPPEVIRKVRKSPARADQSDQVLLSGTCSHTHPTLLNGVMVVGVQSSYPILWCELSVRHSSEYA